MHQVKSVSRETSPQTEGNLKSNFRQIFFFVLAHLKCWRISPQSACVVSRFLCVNIGSVVGQQPLRLELQKASEAAAEAHLKDRSRLLHWEEKLGKNAGKMT